MTTDYENKSHAISKIKIKIRKTDYWIEHKSFNVHCTVCKYIRHKGKNIFPHLNLNRHKHS